MANIVVLLIFGVFLEVAGYESKAEGIPDHGRNIDDPRGEVPQADRCPGMDVGLRVLQVS